MNYVTTQTTNSRKKKKTKQGFNLNEISHGKVEMHTASTERRGTQKEERGSSHGEIWEHSTLPMKHNYHHISTLPFFKCSTQNNNTVGSEGAVTREECSGRGTVGFKDGERGLPSQEMQLPAGTRKRYGNEISLKLPEEKQPCQHSEFRPVISETDFWPKELYLLSHKEVGACKKPQVRPLINEVGSPPLHILRGYWLFSRSRGDVW